MHLELTPFEALCEVLPKSERFDLFDYSAAVALLPEVDHTHASDELMHLRCDLRFQVVIPLFSHSCLSLGLRTQNKIVMPDCDFPLKRIFGAYPLK
jgi:hypothetical protein